MKAKTRRQAELIDATAKLTEQLGHIPTNGEIAKVMGTTAQAVGQLRARLTLYAARDDAAEKRAMQKPFWCECVYDRCQAAESASDMLVRLSFLHNATSALRDALKAGEDRGQIDLAASCIEAGIAAAYRAAGDMPECPDVAS